MPGSGSGLGESGYGTLVGGGAISTNLVVLLPPVSVLAAAAGGVLRAAGVELGQP
jgi:hypothetical protein